MAATGTSQVQLNSSLIKSAQCCTKGLERGCAAILARVVRDYQKDPWESTGAQIRLFCTSWLQLGRLYGSDEAESRLS